MTANGEATPSGTLGQVYGDGQLLVEREGGSAWLCMNRPAKKNAISNAMLAGLEAALDAVSADESVRTIVLVGAGECFTSGRDIKEFGSKGALEDGSLERIQDGFLRVLERLGSVPKPTIAAVHGFALGGGQALSLACDFVVAERDARFGNVEMSYGFPAAMNIVLLARHVGRRLGLEIAMTGQTYTAERYYEMGLVNRLAESGELRSSAEQFAAVLNALPPWAVARTKSTFRLAEDLSMQGGLHLGSQLNQLLMLSSQNNPVHTADAGSKAALKAGMQGGREC